MVKIGDSVTFVDTHGREHSALITVVHGSGYGPENQPAVNLLYVSDDENQKDQYGRQIIRSSSVCHKSNQGASGYYWM